MIRFQKDILKVRNTLLKWILQNISENQTFQENSKVYDGRFLRNGFHERYCYIGKSRSDVQDLEKSANQSFLVERWN